MYRSRMGGKGEKLECQIGKVVQEEIVKNNRNSLLDGNFKSLDKSKDKEPIKQYTALILTCIAFPYNHTFIYNLTIISCVLLKCQCSTWVEGGKSPIWKIREESQELFDISEGYQSYNLRDIHSAAREKECSLDIRLKTECKRGKLKSVRSSEGSPRETGTWRGEEGHVYSCETLSVCPGEQDPVKLY